MARTFTELVLISAASFEVAVIVKATLIVGLALVASHGLNRVRASVRHALIAAMFGTLLALPVVMALLPTVPVPITVSTTSAAVDYRGIPEPSTANPTEQAAVPIVDNGAASPVAAPRFRVSLATILRAVWVSGFTLSLIPVVASLWQLRRTRRHGLPWLSGEPLVRDIATEAGISRRVEVLIHPSLMAPLTCGAMRPAIFLPTDVYEWSDADVRRAVVHELEHVRRNDWLIHLFARFTCAVYWFHPLIWIVWRQLGLESERACDDEVLAHTDRTEYADQLVRLASRMGNHGTQTLAMANRSDLSARVAAVLKHEQARGPAGSLSVGVTAAVALIVLLTISPLRAVESSQRVDDDTLTNRIPLAAVDREPLRAPSLELSPAIASASAPLVREARAQAAASQPIVFENVSITPNDGRGTHRGPVLSGDTFSVVNTPVLWLIQDAYGLDQYQIFGGPDSIRPPFPPNHPSFVNITAKVPAAASKDQLHAMMRQLLADRFHLVAHKENRDTPVSILRIADAGGALGPKLTRASASCDQLRAAAGEPISRTVIPCQYDMQIGRMGGLGVDMKTIVGWFGREVHQPILDKTGLEGIFNINLSYTPEPLRHHSPDRFPTVDPEGPSFFDAVRDQLGLSFERDTGMGDVLVIDRIESPTFDASPATDVVQTAPPSPVGVTFPPVGVVNADDSPAEIVQAQALRNGMGAPELVRVLIRNRTQQPLSAISIDALMFDEKGVVQGGGSVTLARERTPIPPNGTTFAEITVRHPESRYDWQVVVAVQKVDTPDRKWIADSEVFKERARAKVGPR